MEAWWRDDCNLPKHCYLTPQVSNRVCHLSTPGSGIQLPPSVHTTVSAPTPACSSWPDTPSRRAFSSTKSTVTDDHSRDSSCPTEDALQTKTSDLGFNDSPLRVSLSRNPRNNSDRHDIGVPERLFENAPLLHAKKDSVDTLRDSARTVIANVSAENSNPADRLKLQRNADKKRNFNRKVYDMEKLRIAIQNLPYKLRHDRCNQKVTDENAQGIFQPDACLFVGKYGLPIADKPRNLILIEFLSSLHKDATDPYLRSLVFTAMSKYGECNVRMTRDSSGVPTAFVQFW